MCNELRTDILAAEEARYRAMIAGDSRELAGILDVDLIYTHSDGSRDTRETYLAKLISGYFCYRRIDQSIELMHTFDETAIIAGRMLADVKVGDDERNLTNAFLAVYRRREEVWRLVAYQPTPIKQT